ncbi:MAG: amidohydrolase family protein, partial [Selenomonadaceae bacterium]|nr:amidohydrolase family protein [Selenomonadaceae bacterium]
MKLLIKNVHTLLPNGEVKTKNILIENQFIKDVADSVPADFRTDKTINGEGKFAVPGLINAHTHASMTLLRSYADDMALMPWLSEKIWPVEDKMTADDLYWGAMLAAIEMIKSGTTTFADMYGPFVDSIAKAAIDSGLRAVLARGIVAVAPGADEKLEDSVRLYKTYNNAESGRLTVMLSPHSLYTCPPEFLKKMAQTASKIGAEIHTHMSETEGEVKDCVKNYGKRPFAHVESTGLFENGTLAAH